MELEYTKFDPTQNITILIKTPVERSRQAEIAEKVMAAVGDCEQVGFIENSPNGQRLQMMGGEFCGNATMSFAALTALEQGLPSYQSAVEVSGAGVSVSAAVEKTADGYDGRVSMPLPLSWVEHAFARYTVPVVRFPGIDHAIVTKHMPVALAEMLIRQWGKEINSDALGIMLLSEDMTGLTPIVYVRSTDTVVRESSCASGTSAAAVWAAVSKGGTSSVSFTEPGGTLSAEAEYKDGAVTALTLSGKVRILSSGTLTID